MAEQSIIRIRIRDLVEIFGIHVKSSNYFRERMARSLMPGIESKNNWTLLD